MDRCSLCRYIHDTFRLVISEFRGIQELKRQFGQHPCASFHLEGACHQREQQNCWIGIDDTSTANLAHEELHADRTRCRPASFDIAVPGEPNAHLPRANDVSLTGPSFRAKVICRILLVCSVENVPSRRNLLVKGGPEENLVVSDDDHRTSSYVR
jgi:hypothetical protein